MLTRRFLCFETGGVNDVPGWTETPNCFLVSDSLSNIMEARRVVRRRGSHILSRQSQMVVRLSALHGAGGPLPAGRFLVLISVRG
jgi:hypothetical protein